MTVPAFQDSSTARLTATLSTMASVVKGDGNPRSMQSKKSLIRRRSPPPWPRLSAALKSQSPENEGGVDFQVRRIPIATEGKALGSPHGERTFVLRAEQLEVKRAADAIGVFDNGHSVIRPVKSPGEWAESILVAEMPADPRSGTGGAFLRYVRLMPEIVLTAEGGGMRALEQNVRHICPKAPRAIDRLHGSAGNRPARPSYSRHRAVGRARRESQKATLPLRSRARPGCDPQRPSGRRNPTVPNPTRATHLSHPSFALRAAAVLISWTASAERPYPEGDA